MLPLIHLLCIIETNDIEILQRGVLMMKNSDYPSNQTNSDNRDDANVPSAAEKAGDDSQKNIPVKKRSLKAVKKPNPFLFYPACAIASLFFKLRLRTSYDLSGIKNIKGPALVVCPHTSNIDFMFAALSLFPHRPTFVVSDHFMANPKTRWILKAMHVIPKKMFCPDVRTIMSIIRAKNANQIIVLYPEGRLTCVGHSLPVTEGTADLIKKLGIDVYWLSQNGAYKTLPKWGKAGLRPGKVSVTTGKLFDHEDIKNYSIDEIHAALEKVIVHDDEKYFADVEYRCSAPAKGLDGIIYKCPECLEEFKMESGDDYIRCTNCGFESRLSQKYTLSGGPFDTINQWFFWQDSLIDIDEPLSSKVIVGSAGKDGNMDRDAGEGILIMDREKIHFQGTCFGKPLEFTEKTSDIKAFPSSVGSHFDIYHKKIMYIMQPVPDRRQSIKWMMYLDKVTRESK